MNRIALGPLISTLLTLPVAAFAADPQSPSTVPDVVKGITAREISGHMKFLASDLMRGRDTGSPEIRLAAEYLGTRLSAAGADPLGDTVAGKRTYFQAFPLEYVTPQLEGTSVELVMEQNGSKRVIPCQIGVDVDVTTRGLMPGQIEGDVVFAGRGRYNPDQNIDDFKDLNVKGRFVLVYSGRGGNANGGGPRRGGRGGGAGSPRALELGALGVISIRAPGGEQNAQNNRPPSGFGRPSMTLGHAPMQIPTFTFADPMQEVIAKAYDLTQESPPRLLDNFRVRFHFAAKKEHKEDRNVVGFFPGSDPEKAKEVVIYSAHYDHVGVDEKGEIFNGSDDNASGTSALLEIAEAYGDGPKPSRSVAFLWVSGEEKGLLGSQWFADHMTLPEGYKVVADINLDMVSRNNASEIGITPSDKHQDYSTLVPAAVAACKEEGLTAKYDADQYYFRTDSYNFAKKGIPVIFFFCGVHEDYHKATDDFTKADFDKAAKVARSAYRLGWQVAQEKDVPKKIKAEELKAADNR